MPAPTIIDIPNFPSRLDSSTPWEDLIYTWWSGTKTALASWNAFYDWVAANTPGSIGAFGLSCASEVSITATVSLDATAFGRMHVCGGTTADYIVSLPYADGNAGKILGVRIANSCTKLVALSPHTPSLIDGAAMRVMWAGESAVLLCDGTNWIKIAGKTIPMMCKLVQTGVQSIPNAATTKTALNEYTINIGAMANVANYQVMTRRGGNYQVIGTATFDNSIPYQHYIVTDSGSWCTSVTQAGNGYSPPACGLLSLVADTPIWQTLYQTTGSAQNTYITQFPCSLSVIEVPTW